MFIKSRRTSKFWPLAKKKNVVLNVLLFNDTPEKSYYYILL